MSADFQLAWKCSHMTVEEPVRLASDRRTLLVSQPMAANGQVRILVDDDIVVPQSGLLSQAVLKGSIVGPFDLPLGRRTLTITSSGGSAVVQFKPKGSSRMKADEVVRQIQTAIASTGLAVQIDAVQGRVVLTDTVTSGPTSSVSVSGTAASAIGMGDAIDAPNRQRGAFGRILLPGWRLETVPGLIDFRAPRFAAPLRTNPVLRVTYVTASRSCKRCGATQVENDVRLDRTGQAIMVRNEDLLYQAALKVLLTDRATNPYHPWYGTSIRQRIGSKAVGGVAAAISEDVRRALTRMQAIQTAQADVQAVSPRERLWSIDGVRVSPHIQDPTTFLIDVVVRNASNQPVDLSIVYTAPGTVALLGSNGLSLGTEAVGVPPQARLNDIGV